MPDRRTLITGAAYLGSREGVCPDCDGTGKVRADRLVHVSEVVEALRAEMRGGEGPVLVGWRAAADYIEREFGGKR